jgi:NitT/TauT family transport system substrate-binding protein
MQAIIAGELDVGTTASEAAISGRAGARSCGGRLCQGRRALVSRADLKLAVSLKGKSASRGGIQEVLLLAELQQNGLSVRPAGQGCATGLPGLRRPEPGLLGKNIDAMMQSEPQSSQAINKGFGTR